MASRSSRDLDHESLILIWAPQARFDLAEGVNHIARDNVSAAIRVEECVVTAAEGLREFPRKGRRRPDGRRELVVAATPFLLIYRIEDDRLIVLRIWHTSRKPFA